MKLPDPWLSQIEGFLDSVPLAPGPERVLLHTEVIREHLLVSPRYLDAERAAGLRDRDDR